MVVTMNSEKTVGKKQKRSYNAHEVQGFLELIIALRGSKPFIPKGIHRFTTFDESNKWSLKMMARRPSKNSEREEI